MLKHAEGLVLADHDLGDGCMFRSGCLPERLLWDEAAFEAAWATHQTDKHQIMMHGRLVQTPRWQQAYGADYHYTGRINKALPLPPVVEPLMAWVREQIDLRINGALLNWYEGPGHYIGPHHDSIKHMVEGSPIVTVSFGETRIFRLTKGKGADAKTLDFPASDGTVFVMPYDTNRAWKHSVPKSTHYTGRRISATFRAFEGGDALVGPQSAGGHGADVRGRKARPEVGRPRQGGHSRSQKGPNAGFRRWPIIPFER
jgi:alkylated DNA repair dioxygenase AlkB